MSNKEITGVPVWESCNNRNNILINRFSELKLEEDKLRKEIKERQERIDAIREEYKDLNETEVNNILDYVRCYVRSGKLEVNEIDTLLCHCQNKLNGNINSVFLAFEEPELKE